MMLTSHAQHRFALFLAGPVGVALLVAYCHVWSGETGVSIGTSIRWALVTVASWAAFGFVIWWARGRLEAHILRSRPRDLAVVAAQVFAVGFASAVLSTALLSLFADFAFTLDALRARIVRLIPALLLVASVVTAGMAAWKWRYLAAQYLRTLHAARSGADAGDWIELPEAPNLRLRSSELAIIRTARNYCELSVANRTVLVRVTAKELERRLSSYGFARIHRNTIVNLSRVRMMQPAASGRAQLFLDDGTRVPVSRAYVRRLADTMVAPLIGDPDLQAVEAQLVANER